MDVWVMSIGIHQAYLQNVVSISIVKMDINSGVEIINKISDMMNMAVDTSKGLNMHTKAQNLCYFSTYYYIEK